MRKGALLTGFCLFLGVAATANGLDLGISVGSGVCLLRQKAVRDAYGAGIPFGVQAWAGGKKLKISVGIEFLFDRGEALPLNDGQDRYLLNMNVTSVPIALYYWVVWSDVFFALGGGANYSNYKERWEDLDIVTKGQKWGPLVACLAGSRLRPKLSVFGSLRFDPMPTGKGSLLVPEVKLGGLKIMAGLLFSLNQPD